MTSSITQTDQKFWLAYCEAIRSAAGFDANAAKSSAIFFGTTAQKGPPAGDKINQYFTNTGLFAIADNLLQPDNLFYVPSASNSYIRSLMTYLGYVDLKGNPTSDQFANLTTLFENQRIAQKLRDTEQDTAFAAFGKDVTRGMVQPGMSFPSWATLNAPSYSAAKKNYDSASAQYQTAINVVYGAQSGTYNADLARINASVYPTTEQEGLTMYACQSSPASSLAIWQAVQGGTQPPDPTGKYLVAYYSSPNYKNIVTNFMGFINNSVAPTKKIEVNLSQGQNMDTSVFGIKKTEGSADFGWIPWFSINVSGSSTESFSAVMSESESQNVKVVMTYKDIQTADITPGQWNIGDPKKTYSLKSGAPSSVRTLVRPSRLVLGCGVGWQISFSAGANASVNTAMSKLQTAGGGYLNILGFTCSVGGSSTVSTENTSHYAKWDDSGMVLDIAPTLDAGYATILAVIGEKIDTA